MPEGILTFEAVRDKIKRSKDRRFHLLLGNGFSMAYNPGIFSYNALHDFVVANRDKSVARLFDLVGTTNFELVMRQLQIFAAIAEIFGADQQLKSRVDSAGSDLSRNLLEAIEGLHPEHVFTISEGKSAACAAFLRTFLGSGGSVFTANYDLLLYWVLMRNEILGAVDGFGRDREDEGEFVPSAERQYSELRWGRNSDSQTVHYLHGALHLFDTGIEVIKEEYDGEYLLENIRLRISKGQYPLFVTAGDGEDKVRRIRQNPYLQFCLEALRETNGSLVTFGFNFGDHDAHILRAINRAARQNAFHRLWSVYIGIFSDEDEKHINSIKERFRCKVHVFDSKTAPVWSDG